jgi:hypothetical protein
MSNFDREIEMERTRSPRRWTGRMILLTLLAFFGVVFAVNGVLIHEALSTFGGVDTESAYQAGRMFEQDVAMAKAQDARQWHVDAKMTPSPDGARRHGCAASRHRRVGCVPASDRSPPRSAGRRRRRRSRPLSWQCRYRAGPMGSRDRTVAPRRATVPVEEPHRSQVSADHG